MLNINTGCTGIHRLNLRAVRSRAGANTGSAGSLQPGARHVLE